MITIEVTNIKSRLIGDLDPKVISALYNKLSMEVIGAYYAQKSNPYWDGKRHFFSKATRNFSTGLLSYVREVLEKHKIEYEYNDLRVPIQLGPKLPLSNSVLREYQQQAVNLSLQRQRGIIKIATGGGKTLVAASLVANTNVKTLILIHKVEVFYQIIETLEKVLKVPVGKIGDGICDIQQISVGLIQTVARAFESKVKTDKKDEKVIKEHYIDIKNFVSQVECMIFDETHHVASDTFQIVIENAPNAFFKWGLSASPWRTDNCLIAKTDINLADGSKQSIRDLYFDPTKEVLGYNIESKEIKPSKILKVHRKEVKTELLKFTIRGYGRKKILVCTPEHLFFVPDKGWVEAKNLTKKDDLLTIFSIVYNKGKKGLPSAKKGKTYEELYGIEKAQQLKKEISEKVILGLEEIGWADYMRENNKLIPQFGKDNPMFGKPAWNRGLEGMVGKDNPMFGKKRPDKTEENIKRLKGKKWDDIYPAEKAKKLKTNMSNRQLGKLNPNWNNGASFEPYTPEFNKKLKKAIFERDGFLCKFHPNADDCAGKKLVAHHIDYDKKNCSSSNLISVCDRANAKVNFNREKWTLFFKETFKCLLEKPILLK